MCGEVSCYFEIVFESGLANHFIGVPAYGNRNSGLKIMMIIQGEPVRKFGDCSLVVRHMTKVFTDVFKIAFEGSHGHGIEIDHSSFSLDIIIVEGYRCFIDGSVVETSYFGEHAPKIFCI